MALFPSELATKAEALEFVAGCATAEIRRYERTGVCGLVQGALRYWSVGVPASSNHRARGAWSGVAPFDGRLSDVENPRFRMTVGVIEGMTARRRSAVVPKVAGPLPIRYEL